MKPTPLLLIVLFCSCFHTKKTVDQFSRKADSTGFFKSDSSRVSRKDSSSSSLDLKDVTVDIYYGDTAAFLNKLPKDDDYPGATITRVIKSISNGAQPRHIKVTIGSANYDHSHIISTDSITDVDTSSIKVISTQTEYHKNVDRKGTGIGGSFLMIGGIILAILIVAAIIYFKFIKKIPFI